MKPPPFDYLRPGTLDEALQMLAQHGTEAKILAGGQSLVPMMNFRLAAPRTLIDINRIAALSGIEATSEGLRLGALVRWHELEKSQIVAAHNPLLRAAVRHIAHFQIRNRGTIGGSSAHADPAAEFPAVAIACGARFTVQRANGTRVIGVDDFFRGPLETALEPDELLVDIRFPAWPATRRWGFQEFARRAGDFALAGAIAVLDLDDSGVCLLPSLVSFATGDRPMRLARAEACLRRQVPTRALMAQAARVAAEDCDAKADMHAPADYRRSLFETLMFRALCSAAGLSAREAA